MSYLRALKLNPDNFTARSRTPWAGTEIAKRYKAKLLPELDGLPIGESWEVSCDPDFPSLVLDTGKSLAATIAESPEALLSEGYCQRKGPQCEILIKLLNPASPLSVQVHPTDDDPYLKAGESGKPESWLVLDAEPGAGIYLGFAKAFKREVIAKVLEKEGDLRPYLHFVEVAPGDYFEIQPGVPHAIGPGVILLEPQRVLSGKSGKTYRFWDWGRKYAKDGTLDPERGEKRELHVLEGLRLIDPERQVAGAFVQTLRREAKTHTVGEGTELSVFPANPYYQVHRLKAQLGINVKLDVSDGFATLTALAGQSTFIGRDQSLVNFAQGESGFLPAAAFPFDLKLEKGSELILVTPAMSSLRVASVGSF